MERKAINVFALEGAPLAGKTTLLDHYQNVYPGEIHVIPEITEYIGGHENNPRFPFQTYEEAKESTHFVLAVEKRRCEDALREFERDGRPVVMDRVTPLFSSFLFLLLEKMNEQTGTGLTDFSDYMLSMFQGEVEKGNIFIPSKVIYVRPASQEVFKARIPRGVSNTIFTSLESLQFFDNYYQHILNGSSLGFTGLVLSSDNSEESLQRMSGEMKSFIESNQSSGYETQVFRYLLDTEKKRVIPVDVENEEKKYVTVYDRYNSLMDR